MPLISVIVPSYNPEPVLLKRLFDSLLAQDTADFEVIVVDDASDGPEYAPPEDARFRIIRRATRSGPAACRNAGAREAAAPLLFFTDTDCELEPQTLSRAMDMLRHCDVSVGDTITRVTTPFGRAVALLGFPGGGILGFDRVWRVTAEGRATSFSSCNLAMRRDVFFRHGGFDESFPVPGGEDTVLARQMLTAGVPMHYEPNQRVWHIQKDTLRQFLRWQLTRGRGNFHIRRRIPKVGNYLQLRIWTFSNSLKKAGFVYFLPVIILIILSVVFQILGYYQEKNRFNQHA